MEGTEPHAGPVPMGGTQRRIGALHAIQAWSDKKTAQKCTSPSQPDGTLFYPANHHHLSRGDTMRPRLRDLLGWCGSLKLMLLF
eukprot:6373605-Amphidinium_carterae.4